jgi:hypothetical protein
MEIKIKDLVTIDLGRYSTAANTYEVVGFSEDKTEAFLTHPIVDKKFFISAPLKSFNHVQASLQSATERCLLFAKQNKELLGYKLQAELEALILYFFVNKVLAPTQKESLSAICAKIGSIILKNDLQQAIDLVNSNEMVLDDFNRVWYENAKALFTDVKKISNKNKRLIVWKISGFIMAQIQGDY